MPYALYKMEGDQVVDCLGLFETMEEWRVFAETLPDMELAMMEVSHG